jgi:hypothetical protein
MLERTQVRVLPALSRTAEHAPMATACCNACRTCAQANAIALLLAGAAGIGAAVARLAGRLTVRL